MDSWGRSNVYNSSSGSRYGKSVSNLATSNTTNANQINRYTSQLHNLPLNDGFHKGELSYSQSAQGQWENPNKYVGSLGDAVTKKATLSTRREQPGSSTSWGQWGYEEVPPNDPYREEEDRRPSWNSEKDCNSRNSSLPGDTHSECRRSLFDIDYEAETGLQLQERDDSPYNHHDLIKSDDSDESDDDIDELERDMELARRNAQHDWVPEIQSRKRDKSPCKSRDTVVASTEVEKIHDFAGKFENVAVYPYPQSIPVQISAYSNPQSNPTTVTLPKNINCIRNKIQNTIAKIPAECQRNPPQPGVSVEHPSHNSSTFLHPRINKKQSNMYKIVIKKSRATKLMTKDGLSFLQALGEQTNLKITVEKQKRKFKSNLHYVCVFIGPPSQRIEAQEAIERYLSPLGSRRTIKTLFFKSDCNFASLRENLQIVDSSGKYWTRLAKLRYKIVQKKERLLNTCTNIINPFDLVKVVREVQRNYSALNAMILGKLDVADGPKHMQILRQWLQQSNESTAMTSTIGFSFNYVFNYDSALDIDYREVINRLYNDEKLEEKLQVKEMLRAGVALCKVRGWTERLSHYRSLYEAIIISNYSTQSVEQFKKNYLQLHEDQAEATLLPNIEVGSEKQSLMNRELPIANSCALEQQALQGHSLKIPVIYNQLQRQNFSYVGSYNQTSNCRDYSHDYSEDIQCSNFVVPANQANLGVAETSSVKEDAVVIVESEQGETDVQSEIGGRQCGASTDGSLGSRPLNFDKILHKRKRKLSYKKKQKRKLKMKKEQQIAAINAMIATHQNVSPRSASFWKQQCRF